MTKKQDKPEALPPQEAKEVRELNPTNPPSVGPADIRPTAAEYERDAILDEEDRVAAEKRAEETRQAIADGKLPPQAQSLEEARQVRDEAADRAAREAEAKKL